MIFFKTLEIFLLEVSRFLRNEFSEELFTTKTKNDTTPVTSADTYVDSWTRNFLQGAFPEYGIISEEGEDFRPHAEYQWVFDPIDGTIPFSTGTPTFCFALVHNGVPIVGAIVDPIMGRILYAEKDEGAYIFSSQRKNRIHIPKDSGKCIAINSLESAVFSISGIQKSILRRNMYFVFNWSAIYSAMLVALGHHRGITWLGKSPWDAAASAIIIKEAGGKVTNFFGKNQKYDKPLYGFVASHPSFHDGLMEILAENRL